MKTEVLSTSTGYPISLEDIKNHLRIGIGETAEDDYLAILRDSAINTVEDITGLKLMTETHKAYYDTWPDDLGPIDLPYAPLQSVPATGIVWTDSTSNSTTLSSTKWATDAVSIPGRVVLDYNESEWSTGILHNNNPIAVEFVCGHSSTRPMPSRVKQALFLLISNWYENREPVVVQPGLQGVTVESVPKVVKSLLNDLRVRYLG